MSEHIVSKKIYFVIFAVLMVGTILTYLVALRDMDSILFTGANTVIALTIAFAKATCVVLFFMHVKYSSKLIMVYVLSGIFWLGVMFLLTMTDFTTRPVVTTGPPSQTAPAAAPEKAGGEGEHGKPAPAHE
jgi:cytochrome c oxidase subunit 4